MSLTRSSRRWLGAVAGTALTGTILAGCGSSTPAPSATSLKPQSGGTIVYAGPPQTDINWYIPIVNAGFDSLYNFQLIDQLYKPLIWINHDYKVNWQTSIAKSVSSNAAGTVFHVFLHKKWHWSNGQPVTTRDVLFTWHVIEATSAKNAPLPWPYVNAGVGGIPNNVQSLVPNGPYEFTITLKQPANQQWFLYNGIAQLVPMPAAAWDRYPNDITREITYLGGQATNPKFDTVVDGPYKLTRAVDKQSWTLTPNPAYDGHHAYDTIVMTYEASNAAEFAALKTGQLQVGVLDLSQWGARGQLSNDLIRPGYGFSFFDTELNMNPADPGGLGSVFKQLYVRQALEMGINQPAIDQSIWHGFAPPQYGPIPAVPKTAFLDPSLTKPLYPYDPAQGKAILKKHGWHEVNGVMTRHGVKLAFNLLLTGGSTVNTETAEILKEGWAREGVQVTLEPEPFATLEGTISNPKAAWSAATDQGIIYGGSYPTGGELFGSQGGLNNFGYSSKTMDHLIALTHQPYSSSAASLKAFRNYEVYAARQLPVLWMNNAATLAVNAKTVHNSFRYFNYLVGYPRMQYWWIAR